ncbi:MAG: hypothetical protein HKO59_02810 [Phycisphaerales bacterium]|nr:hypothetical protein [Phycisphaerae bacterium]NNF43122.1 hypothetical protein [Phycisphaerales bacterium]NNM24912.1 hypothetical protein [Phycisphaerales bacterium]
MEDERLRAAERNGACPHIDRNDPRCATRFCLGRIEQAFSVCFGAFHGCPMFHRINCEETDVAPVPALVTITVARHAVEPLRPTGT